MIYTNIPYAPNGTKDLGGAYNSFMELLKDDDYAIFLDHDACFTTYMWFSRIEQTLKDHPHVEAFTCATNRVWCNWQLAPVSRSINDIVYHREYGQKHAEQFRGIVENVTKKRPWMSGVLIGLKKSAWTKMGGFKHGMLGIDNKFHMALQKTGVGLYMLKEIYLYHYYSNSNLVGKRNTDHLK